MPVPSCITGIGAIVPPCMATGDGAGANGESVEVALAVPFALVSKGTSVRSAATLPHWLTGSEDHGHTWSASVWYRFREHVFSFACPPVVLVTMPHGGSTWQWKC